MVFNVQVMRAIAATLVVWVHTQELIVTDVLPHWLRSFGYGGVDLFFVISGFIMVRTTQNKNIRPIQFYRKRILRVAPLYAFFTILVVILSTTMPDVLNSTQIEVSQIAKSLVFIPFEKTPDSLYPIYYLGWTLNYEMFFYSIFAAALLFSNVPGSWRSPLLSSLLPVSETALEVFPIMGSRLFSIRGQS